eukprot:1818756-Amphidinium_carterae.1
MNFMRPFGGWPICWRSMHIGIGVAYVRQTDAQGQLANSMCSKCKTLLQKFGIFFDFVKIAVQKEEEALAHFASLWLKKYCIDHGTDPKQIEGRQNVSSARLHNKEVTGSESVEVL